MEALDYDAFVGQKVGAARSRTGMSEADLADRMCHLGFLSWGAQTVQDAELGAYALAAVEVLGISLALEVAFADLLQPTLGEQWVVQLQDGPVVALRGFVPIMWDGNTPISIPSPVEKTRHE
jgi:hypothetical protein